MSVLDLFSLRGECIVVTGAGSGLGRAMAEGLGGAGASVVCVDMVEETAAATAAGIKEQGGEAMALAANVTDEAAVQAMIEAARTSYGRLDVIFCNAGMSGHYNRIDEVDLAEWRQVLDVNLTGVMLCAKHASRVMIPQRSGKIIVTASIWGLVGSGGVPIPEYAASKGGVVNLTHELALELIEFGITVNAIAPGFFGPTNLGRDKEKYASKSLYGDILSTVPTHRYADPSELQGTAIYLASHASDMVNGHILVIDGGVLAK